MNNDMHNTTTVNGSFKYYYSLVTIDYRHEIFVILDIVLFLLVFYSRCT